MPPNPIRIAPVIDGHVHPSFCKTHSNALLAVYNKEGGGGQVRDRVGQEAEFCEARIQQGYQGDDAGYFVTEAAVEGVDHDAQRPRSRRG